MAAKPPVLDDRALKELLQQLQTLAATQVPEWRPPTEGDAGTMLQRIFARLMELALQRLNQTPEKNLLAFLDTMGVSLLSPSPARVPLTFALTPGTPPTLVPQASQAVTKAAAQQAAVTFETESDLTVIPALLATGFTIDPVWDRYSDQTAALGGQVVTGFTPFVGTKRMPHILYIGNDALLNIAGTPNPEAGGVDPAVPNATLTFRWQSNQPQSEVQKFFERLSFQSRRQGRLAPLSLPSFRIQLDTDTFGVDIVSFNLGILGPIDLETIRGIGLIEGIENRWLRIVLTTPFPDDPVAKDLRLSSPSLTVGASELSPDFVFSNNSAVDISKDFFPFGETPKLGDTFYLANREAFSKPESTVTISFKVRPLPPPKLVWEYFDSRQNAWLPFVLLSQQPDPREFSKAPFSYMVDGTKGFTTGGPIDGVALQMGRTTVNGVNAFWVRIRIIEGAFRLPPVISSLIVQASPANGVAIPEHPVQFGFANDDRINDLSRDFLPFGSLAGTGDAFYFGETAFRLSQFSIISIIAKLNPNRSAETAPPATLVWEYFGANGWAVVPGVTDNTRAFTRGIETAPPPDHTVTLLDIGSVEKEVNGKTDYWVRVRIIDGDYGRPAEFVPVDPDDPKQGFKVRPGTGNLQPPQLQSLKIDYFARGTPTALTQNGFLYTNQSIGPRPPILQPSGINPFVSVKELMPNIYADAEPTFYLGFDAAFPEEPVTLYVDAAPRAFAGSVIKEARAAPAPSSLLPPLRWEYFNGTAWRALTTFDGTNNLTESGTIEFLTPTDIARLAKFDLTARYWVRARSSRNDPFDTQRSLGVFLNTVPAIQALTVQDEILGSSNGRPDQTLRLTRAPLLAGQQIFVREPEPPSDVERAAVEKEEGKAAIRERVNPVTGENEILVRWHQIDTFLLSGPRSRHYTLDHTTGELKFGDGKRGLIPPPGVNNLIATYRAGGGTAGNAPKAAVAQIKSALPGVGGVTNPATADGGAAAETVTMVEERGPQTLKHRYHAVASADLEYLARQAAGTRVARAKCLSNVNRELRFEPGWTTLIIVPTGAEAKLSPSSELIREVEDYIGARDFIGLAQQTPARVNVIGPGYIQVAVIAEVVPQDINRAEQVKQQLLAAIAAFLHPLTGGPDRTGWIFGRDVYASEVYQLMESVPGVDHVESLRLIPYVARHRLTFTSAPVTVNDLPAGSAVMRADGQKAVLLAEPVAAGEKIKRIAIKGFKEGDRVTIAADLVVQAAPTGNQVDVRMVSPRTSFGFPLGSLVTTLDGTRRTQLNQAIGRDVTISRIEVADATFAANLQPRDTLTVFYPFPMTVTSVTMGVITLTVQSVSSNQINVAAFNSSAALTPRGSLVITSDQTRRTRLSVDISGAQEGLTQITVADPLFAGSLRPGDSIELHVPELTLGIEDYETETVLPDGFLLVTLDNRIRLPLLTPVAANQTVTSVRLADFFSGEAIAISRRDKSTVPTSLTIQDVEPVGDIVYLDDNFLVYSGAHRITMISDPLA